MSTVRKLIVEVVDARDLLPKDGQGKSSPYVILDYYGQRKRTQTVARDLNPTWNETLEFNVGKKSSDVFEDVLEPELEAVCRKGEEALIYYPLGKRNLFNWVQGELGLKIYYVDEVVQPPLPPPPSPLPAVEQAPESAPVSAADTDVGKSDPATEEAPKNASVPPSPARSEGGEKASLEAPKNVSVPPSPAPSVVIASLTIELLDDGVVQPASSADAMVPVMPVGCSID